MEGNAERCPPTKPVKEAAKINEAKEPKEKRELAKKTTEKLPPKSERQQKFEERLKGTAWKITKVDTMPSYRPARDVEKAAYADLSDAAAEKAGLKRTYNEQGKLIKTEIADTTDHKATLELGGKEFTNKLPFEVRQYAKSLNFSGPNIALSNILIASDGSANVAKMSLRVSDRDYEPSVTQNLENMCKNVLKLENNMLTPKALQNMEKAAIEWYSQQSAMHLDDTSIKDAQEKASDSYQKGVEEDIKRMSDKWVATGKEAFIASGVNDASTVSKVNDKNGHGIVWSNIANSFLYDGRMTLGGSDDITNFSVKVYIDLASGNIGKVVLNKSKKNEAGLIPSQENMQEAESEELTKNFAGRPVSVANLLAIKSGLKEVIKDVPVAKKKEQEERDEKAQSEKDNEDRKKQEERGKVVERMQSVFDNWTRILEASSVLDFATKESLTVGSIDQGKEQYGFIWGFKKYNDDKKEYTHFTLKAEVDLKTGKFKNFELRTKKELSVGLDSDKEKVLGSAAADLNGIFVGKDLSKEVVADLADKIDSISDERMKAEKK